MALVLEMGVAPIGWISLVSVLMIAIFGVSGVIWLILYVLAFLLGFLALLWFLSTQKHKDWRIDWGGVEMPSPGIGVPKLVDEMKSPRPHLKMDKRMTGSSPIDDVLTEILNYIYRDYIQSWYRKISDDERFQYDMRLTLQNVIIALSERAKDIDLVPYLTTRIVDDFASHIRLYRRAFKKVQEHKKDESDTKPPADLESTFFDLECEMENNMCRDFVCMSEEGEREYLQDLSDVLMFLLLPQEDFHNKPFRYIVREVLVNAILLPTINMLSDPDYMNQTISWLTKDTFFTNEYFLTILRYSDNIDELVATKEKVDLDIARQRSKDTGGSDDAEIKQQLNSLMFVKQVCEQKIDKLQRGVDDSDALLGLDYAKLLSSGKKLYSLPFDVVLNNNIALAYFIEYMTNIGCQQYLLFYLTVEGYRVSAEQQISAALLNNHGTPDLEMLKDASLSIFNTYISEKAQPRVNLDEKTYKQLVRRIHHEDPNDKIFDEAQLKVAKILQGEERFFPTFRRSQIYIRLLAELNLLETEAEPIIKEEEFEEIVEEEEEMGGGVGVRKSQSDQNHPKMAAVNGSPGLKPKAVRSTPSFEADETSSHTVVAGSPQKETAITGKTATSPTRHIPTPQLSAMIENKGVCREHGKQYAVYLIAVKLMKADGSVQEWYINRRYSDFYELHNILIDRFPNIAGLALPSKKTFNNMSEEFLEKRKAGLNAYLQLLLSPILLKKHPGLYGIVYTFLENMVWEKEKVERTKMETMTKPLKNVSKFMMSMPDNFVDGVVKMSGSFKQLPNNMLDGVGKMLNVKGPTLTNIVNAIMNDDFDEEQSTQTLSQQMKVQLMDSGKVGASLDIDDGDDDIPLRIMLLLLDEVFEIQERNQWLRRRIVALLRQIVHTMFGDSLNKKIVDQVEYLTSAEQIAEYLKTGRETLWPKGILAEARPPREEAVRLRTRVVAKAKMLGTVADELRHLLGSETTREGVLRIFNMVQHQSLNRRLVYVILEGLLETIFPENKFREVFRKLHSRSNRVKKSQSKVSVHSNTSSESGSSRKR